MFRSLRLRLSLSHLLVILIAMGLLGFLLLSFLERYFLQAMEQNLVAQARITAQTLFPGALAAGPAGLTPNAAYNTLQQQNANISVQTQNFGPLSGTISLQNNDLAYFANASVQLSSQLDTRIRILDHSGRVLVDSQQEQQGQDLQSDPLVAQALTGHYASRTDSLWVSQAAMHVALPVAAGGRLAGVVYLSQPLRDVAAVVRDVRLRWLLATGIALLLSALAGWLLSRAVARPVHSLTVAAQAVAGGKLDTRVPVTSRDEVGQLSEVFNEMTVRLQESRRVQSDFVANVSHELRTPLTSVKGLVETLRAGAVDDAEVRDHFLSTVEGETDRLIRLVNDLLLLSRVDSTALQLQRRPLDLAEVARTAAERLAPQAEARRVDLRVEAAPGLPLAWADPDRMTQVLFNLLDNAVKFSHPGGTVRVRVAEAGQALQVQVQDEGAGIPAGELARIGERFYRADRARSRADGGSGLGLSIAQALVAAHGGELRITSEEGKGTLVTVTLPAYLSPEHSSS